VTVPRAEIEYIALLLESAEDDELEEKIIILVATHGKNTASSMVEVAKRLFSSTDTNIIAIDMPLEVNPQEVLEQTAAMLKGMECQKGVLILADMGSLCNIGALLAERLKIPVRTLDMVSTPLILEAMRKVDIAGMDLDSIYESLLSFKGYEAVDTHELPINTQEAIVTICSSGHGAAMKLKALVEDVLRHAGRIIEVIPIGVLHMDDRLAEIAKEYRIVAAVGMKKPAMNVPFIPLEQLIDGEGERLLTELVFDSESVLETSLSPNEGKGKGNMVVQRLCEESLQRFLTYLNPSKIMSVLLDFDKSLEADLQLRLSNPLRVRLLVHCGCALERVVTRSPLVYKEDKSAVDEKKLMALKKAAKIFDETLKLRFDEDEYYFMANML
jgi:transcriptional regulatory protein LevR